jgi:hypothetical protein
VADLLAGALAGFQVLAREEVELAAGAFRAFVVPGWPSPSFSPVLRVGQGRPGPDELAEVERFWARRWTGCGRAPCFLLPVGPADPQPGGAPALGRWEADDRPLRVVVEVPPGPALPPNELVVDVHGVDDPAARERFLAGVAAWFPDAASDPARVLAMLEAPGATTELLAVREPRPGAPVLGMQATTVRRGAAFQSWGWVDEGHRGRGCSRAMEHAARHRAFALGAGVSATTTRNEHVVGRSRPTLDCWIYRLAAAPSPPSPGRLAGPSGRW